MALSDPPHNPIEAQELFKTSLTADVIHNREISFPPNVGYFPVPPHTFDRSSFDLELAYASSASVSGLMAALPQWNLDPASEAVDKKPWRSYGPTTPSSIHGVKEAVTLPLSTNSNTLMTLMRPPWQNYPPDMKITAKEL